MPPKGLTLAVLCALLLAGCTSPEAPVVPEAPAPRTALEAELVPSPGNATGVVARPVPVDPEEFLLAGSASADGDLTGFRWTIPRGALVPFGSFAGWEYLYLEVLPVVPSDQATPVEEWDLFVFRLGREAELLATVLNPTLDFVGRPGVLFQGDTVGPSLQPFYISMLSFDDELEEGDELGFVLAARSPESAEMGLLLRVADDQPDYTDLPEEPDDFPDAVSLPPAGTGKGLQTALYADINSLLVLGYTMQTPAAVVEERLPVELHTGVSVRDMTVSASYPNAGWTFTSAQYWGSHMQGTWDLEGDLHGTAVDTGGVASYHMLSPTTIAEVLAFGLPVFEAVQEGEGASSAAFTVLVSNVDYYEYMQFMQVDLGTDLASLLGTRSGAYATGFNGLVGDVPPSPVLREDGLLHTTPAGVSVLFPGIRG
jgi:hypothetical protein